MRHESLSSTYLRQAHLEVDDRVYAHGPSWQSPPAAVIEEGGSDEATASRGPSSENGRCDLPESLLTENARLGLLDQNGQLIQENRALVEENSKLVEENLLLQEECQQLKLANTKLMLQLDKMDMKITLTENQLRPRSHSVASLPTLHDLENVDTPRSSRRHLSLKSLEDPLGVSRQSSSSRITPFRPTAVDGERGIAGSIGRWSSKDLLVPTSCPKSQRSPVRGLILRVGHLMHPVPELEAYADFLEKQGFTTRESLGDLTEDIAEEFDLPLKLASALRAEVANNHLKRRYSGPVLPLQEIEGIENSRAPEIPPAEMTPKARHHINSKDPKSTVCRQVLRVGHRLHAPWELQKFARILEDNFYRTRESLQGLTDEDAVRLRIPLKLAAALRDKALQDLADGGRRRRNNGGGIDFVPTSGSSSLVESRRSSAQLSAPPARQGQSGYEKPRQQQQQLPQPFPQQFNQNFMPQPLVPVQNYAPPPVQMASAPMSQALVPVPAAQYRAPSPPVLPGAAPAWSSPRGPSARHTLSPRLSPRGIA